MAVIPVVVLAVVFLLVAIRQVGGLRLQIWQIMFAGAAAVLVTGQISPLNAALSIDLNVMFFLFGMFVVGQALDESGYISRISRVLFGRARSVDSLVLSVLFFVGFASAFLMNDTMAIIGTPLVLLLARSHRISPKLMLLSLAFAVTIGSAMSPIGNPQNLLIAVRGGVRSPFITFFQYLLIPTFINLLLAYLLLRVFFRKEFGMRKIRNAGGEVRDKKLATTCRISLFVLGAMVTVKIALALLNTGIDFSLTIIALAAAAPVLLMGPRRKEILRKMDWQTLVFFASMFILMESVWETGFIQSLIGEGTFLSNYSIVAFSVVLSQFISNVPLVALILPLVAKAPTAGLMALAAGSTIAGNLTILGAASNVIIVQNAEKRGSTLSFTDFVKVGAPLTLVNAAVYMVFLSFF